MTRGRTGAWVLGAMLGAAAGCEGGYSLSDEDREPLIAGDVSLMRALVSFDEHAVEQIWVVAQRAPSEGSGTLEVVEVGGDRRRCAVGSTSEIWVPGERRAPDGWLQRGVVPEVRLGRLEDLDADGFGSLSFFDLRCQTHPPMVAGAHRSLELVDPDRLGAALAWTRDEIRAVDPHTGADRRVASGVQASQLTSAGLWTLEAGRVVRRSRAGDARSEVGVGVRAFSVLDREHFGERYLAYEDDEGVSVLDLETGETRLLDGEACEPEFHGWVLLTRSPCAPEAALVAHWLASDERGRYGARVRAARFAAGTLFYVSASEDGVEELWASDPVGEPTRLGTGLTLPEIVWPELHDALLLADPTRGRWLGRWSPSRGFELLATDVVEVHPVSDAGGRVYALTGFDGEVGRLEVLEPGGELTLLARGVPPGGLHLGDWWAPLGASFIHDFRGPTEGGTLSTQLEFEEGALVRIDDHVVEFEAVGLDFVYAVAAPERRGLWLARYPRDPPVAP